jgi:uncharacterized protein with HEPN domain
MPPRSARARLDDIREALEGIRQTLESVAFEQFAATWHLQRAVERGLEIISEASRSLSGDLKALAPEIPWSSIAAIGNILRHEYQRVEPAIVWNIVDQHLPSLERAIAVIEARLDADERN